MSADLRAAAFAAMDAASNSITAQTVVAVRRVEGRTTWAVGDMVVTLPTLLPGAPEPILFRYWTRILADATGRCPWCGAVADITVDPVRHPAAWHLLPVAIAIAHAPECGTQFADHEHGWFDPAAFD